MKRFKPSEALLSRKIALLKQQFRHLQKDERIYKKRNTRLANEIQHQKEQLKALEDERMVLQKEIFDHHNMKSTDEQNHMLLNVELTAVLKDIHNWQEKVIGTWRDNHISENKMSTRKHNSSGSLKLRSSGTESFSHQETVFPEKKREIENKKPNSSGTESFSYQETVIIEKSYKSSGSEILENEQGNVSPVENFLGFEENSESKTRFAENVSPVENFLGFEENTESKTLLAENKSPAKSLDCEEDSNIMIRMTENVSPAENFLGFEENSESKTRFAEIVERLSLTNLALDSLRTEEMAQSLSIVEVSPDIKDENVSTLETERSKQFSIRRMEVSVPRLNFSPILSLSNGEFLTGNAELARTGRKNKSQTSVQGETSMLDLVSSSGDVSLQPPLPVVVEEAVDSNKKSVAPEPVPVKNTHSRPKKSVLPDSPSDQQCNGRTVRRTRGAVVSYKEKPINIKLRRN